MSAKISIFDLPNLDSFIVLDTETTYNYQTKTEDIVEFCAMEITSNFKILKEMSLLIKPDCSLSKITKEITGLTDMHLEDQLNIETVIDDILSFVQNKPIIAHNASFDKKVLENACVKCNKPLLKNQFIDSLKIAKQIYPSAKNSLTALKERFEIESVSHRAKGDVVATIDVLNNFDQIYKNKKNRSLFELMHDFTI